MLSKNHECTRINTNRHKGSHRNNRVVPLDNFMIYKDIIRLDRPD
ncbi:MAG: hypothetical protein [Olavius algarvensis Gamma 1 endosymbiont]|nr:MAG: hypothetical protein [Olavius algarvensis Gamma 1 endosymbiont]